MLTVNARLAGWSRFCTESKKTGKMDRVVIESENVAAILIRQKGKSEPQSFVLSISSHIISESNSNFMKPCLISRTRVVCPIIDIIHDDTFAYVKSFELHWGAINWEMHFRYFQY